MAVQIQWRRGTAASATSNNPVLAQGEVGWETDTNKFKIGDGATVWNSLPYFVSGGGGAITYLSIAKYGVD
jgi:Major tropism determinant N-terminal domain